MSDQIIRKEDCNVKWDVSLDFVFSSLLEQYNKGEVVIFNDWQEDFLNENIEILLQAIKGQGFSIDERQVATNFKELISRIIPKNNMTGGAGELVVRNNNANNNVTLMNDFKSIVYLMTGILLIILAFIRIDLALKDTLGTNVNDTIVLMFTSIQTAFSKITFEQYHIIKYMHTLFFQFCQDYSTNQGEFIYKNMVYIGFNKVLPKFYNEIINKCGFPNLEGADIRTWNGFLKYANYGASVAVNSATLNSCVSLQATYLAEYEAKALPVTIMANISTIGGLLSTGSLLIANNLPYVYTRIKQLTTNITIENEISNDENQINTNEFILDADQQDLNEISKDLSQLTLNGGRKKKKTKKMKKKTKKTKKMKKMKKSKRQRKTKMSRKNKKTIK